MHRPITVVLAGNPNSGKTTIFNHLTGARQHVGNYPGITVEKKTGRIVLNGQAITIADLPGTYSLTAYSEEEVVARRVLSEEKPDVAIQVVNAGALERNLYLAVQLMELGIPVVLALNMMDEVRSRGDSIDTMRLAHLMGVPVVETVGRTGIGLDAALKVAVDLARTKADEAWKPLEISYGPDVDPALAAMTAIVEKSRDSAAVSGPATVYPARWVALKYLEGDPDIREAGFVSAETRAALNAVSRDVSRHLADTLQSYPEAQIADFRYGYISSLLRQDIVVRHATVKGRRERSDKMDLLLTHTLLGPVIMIGVFDLIYRIAFDLGSYPMGLVDGFFGWLGESASAAMSDGLLKSLVVSGIIAGVGGVLTFVPLILIMFLLIAFLEDTGYMARIAYMLDRVFRFFGLHGSSVMPYIISGGIAGGCAVPGVMATRTLRSPKEKLATMLTLPFMACGAKIPVFMLFVGIFFAREHQAGVMLGITLAGWILALLAARALRSTVITGPPTPFVMELPPYRLPTFKGLLLHTWERGWQYIKKAGTIILAIAIVIWALMTFPTLPANREARFDQQIAALEETVAEAEKAIPAAGGGIEEIDGGTENRAPLPEAKALAGAREALDALKNEKASASLRYSIAGRIGAALEPVSKLAGFDWRTNIALLGGFGAKEVMVSTLGTAYSLGEVDPEGAEPLAAKIQADTNTWNIANAVSLMLFVLIYAPCAVTIAAIRTETGGWRWPLFSLLGSTLLAYVLAVAIYQVGRALLSGAGV